jgi:hypothetical protein
VCQPKIGHLMLCRVKWNIHCRTLKKWITRAMNSNFDEKGCFLEHLDENYLYALKDDSGTIGANNQWAVATNTNHRR